MELTLDDLPAEDVAAAALASRHLRGRFNGVAFAVREDSRLARGLAVLHKASIVTMKVHAAELLSRAGVRLIILEIRFKKAVMP